jgi:pilus assembly protein Flp/PilA
VLDLYVKFQMLRALAGERLNREEGAAAIEYGLIAGLIAIAIVAGATLLGNEIDLLFDRIGTFLQGLTIT